MKTTVHRSDLDGKVIEEDELAEIRVIHNGTVQTLDVNISEVEKLGLKGKGKTRAQSGRKPAAATAAS